MRLLVCARRYHHAPATATLPVAPTISQSRADFACGLAEGEGEGDDEDDELAPAAALPGPPPAELAPLPLVGPFVEAARARKRAVPQRPGGERTAEAAADRATRGGRAQTMALRASLLP